MEDKGKKDGALVELAFGKPSGGDSGDDKPPASKPGDEGLSAAADAVFDALKANDRASFKEALRSYVSQCDSGPMDDDDTKDAGYGDAE